MTIIENKMEAQAEAATISPTQSPEPTDNHNLPTLCSISLLSSSSSSQGTCNICKGTEWGPDDPQVRPCKCQGSMGWVHQSCIQTWITTSGCKTCRVCNTEYSLQRAGCRNLPNWKFSCLSGAEKIRILQNVTGIPCLLFLVLWLIAMLVEKNGIMVKATNMYEETRVLASERKAIVDETKNSIELSRIFLNIIFITMVIVLLICVILMTVNVWLVLRKLLWANRRFKVLDYKHREDTDEVEDETQEEIEMSELPPRGHRNQACSSSNTSSNGNRRAINDRSKMQESSLRRQKISTIKCDDPAVMTGISIA